jgi:hypothetical protein
MDIESNQVITGQLDAGERLLWTGRPGQGLKVRGVDALLIPFSIVWGGFAIFWEVTVIWFDAAPRLHLWGIPFVAMGIYLIIGRFLWDARRRRRTVYAVTDRRVMIVERATRRRIRTVNLRAIDEVAVVERRNRSGDVVLGTPPRRFPFGGWSEDEVQPPRLEFLPNVREVYDIVRRAHFVGKEFESRQIKIRRL